MIGNEEEKMTLSIKTKLLMLQSCLLLFLFFSTGFAGQTLIKRMLFNNIREQLLLTSKNMASQVEYFLKERSGELGHIASAKPVEVYSEKYQDQVLLEHLENFKHEFPVLSYLDERGQEQLKTIRGEISDALRDRHGEASIKAAIAAPNRVIISPAYENNDLGVPVVQMTLARKDYFGHLFRGIIFGAFPLSRLGALLSDNRMEEDIVCNLLDTRGSILASCLPDNTRRTLSGVGKGYDSLMEGLKNRTPLFSEATMDGVDYLAALAPIGNQQWSMLTIIPLEVFLENKSDMDMTMSTLFFGVFIIGLILSLVMAHKIVGPIIQLKKAAHEIGNGHFEYAITIRNKDEIGMLAESFKTMGRNLKEMTVSLEEAKQELQSHNEKLEEQVKNRTAELNLSNEQLKEGIQERIQVEKERKKLETHLAQAQRMEAIGTLAGGTAHNFNNLLMGIEGNVSLMLLEKDPGDPDVERLNSIKGLVSNGAKLTNQLLGYAREGTFEVKTLDLNQLVRQTSDAFSNTKKEIRVRMDLGDNLPGISADQEQIELTLLNLYLNAADAMPDGGDLRIRTSAATQDALRGKPYHVPRGTYLLLEVSDTGMGMDQETMKHIFEPFYTTKGLAKGTGLGLSSVYGIVKGHGGFIDLESEQGKGSIFRIYIPASEQPALREPDVPAPTTNTRRTALLVDDEPMIRDVGVKMMEKLGYRVYSAAGGREAVSFIERHKDEIGIVILDMIMPDMSGEQTYEAIEAVSPGVRVLLSSGYGLDKKIKDLLRLGCAGFIQKPFTMDDLSQKLSQIFAKD